MAMQREGAPTLKRGPTTDDDVAILDWSNLPQGAQIEYLDVSLHDACVVSIRSDLLERRLSIRCDVEHLRHFYRLPEVFEIILDLEGVQSARVYRYSIWPGEFSLPAGLSREEESRLVLEYQSKWREESLSWAEFENAITREDEQVLDIADATLATSKDSAALRLRGHLNYTVYHEVFLRAEKLTISGSDGKIFGLQEFHEFGQVFWDAFSRRQSTMIDDFLGELPPIAPAMGGGPRDPD
ncbi:MAG TPA: hypothetical protein VHX36_04590 [Candidatus Acidoferrales bacterium]|jgi:hypothetical protein|nr:hypothetical protein [Candidatus Acidoferrales bacterium]